MSHAVLTDTDRTARKRHRCLWCGDWIASGSRYREVRGVDDGRFYVTREHHACCAFVGKYTAAWEYEYIDDPREHYRELVIYNGPTEVTA